MPVEKAKQKETKRMASTRVFNCEMVLRLGR